MLENIYNQNPYFFEGLVVDLLLKMGYGDFRPNAGMTTSPSNDGGIDGIINQDVLGLDSIGIQAKRYGGRISIDTIYKTMCNIEFLRRILFRILETTDVKNDWEDGYGRTCSYKFTQKVLNISKDDILFPQPIEMGIRGKDLNEDFINAIDYLNLKEKLDIEKVKNEFNNEVKVLKI